MAITITHEPDALTPVYNTNFFRLVDTDSSNANYKYIIKLYMKPYVAAAYTLIGTFSQFPMNDGTLEFDANTVLNNYIINNDYHCDFAGWHQRLSTFAYKIVVSRTYTGAIETTIKTWDPLYAFDAGVSQAQLDNLTSLYAKLLPTPTTTINRAISNTPTHIELNSLDYYTADFFRHMYNSGATEKATQIGLAIKDATLGWLYFKTDITTSVNFEYDIVSIGIGPKNIGTVTWTAIGTPAVDTSAVFTDYDVSDYKITLLSGADAQLTKEIEVKLYTTVIPNNILGFDRTWLVYKSALGGWSWLAFNMKVAKSQSQQKVTYNRRLKYNETYLQRGATVISNATTQSYKLTSEFVPQEEELFYEELFSSPQVFMYCAYKNGIINTIDSFKPVVVADSTVQLFTTNNDDLFHYNITVEDANQIQRQKR